MSYRLERGRPVGPDLKRIALEQIDRALKLLHDETRTAEKRVHEVRKRGKMIRALLALVGQKELSTRVRDVGRELSESRDAAVVLATFNSLAAPDECAAIRAVLQERADAVGGDGGRLQLVAASVEPRIREVRARLGELGERAALEFDNYSFDDLLRACGRNFRRGRHALRDLVADPTSDAVHEWRKRVKEHWYHMRLLADVCPDVAQSRRAELDALGEMLGNANDLVVLRTAVVDLGGGAALLPRIDELCRELVAAAIERGGPLYEENAKALRTSLRAAHLR